MAKKKKKESQIAKLIMGIRREKKSAKLKEKEIVFEHWHRTSSNKISLRPWKKGGDTMFRCRECHGIVDFGPVVDKSAEEMAKDIKKLRNDFINYCEIGKLSLNPKRDEREKKLLVKAEKAVYRASKLLKIAVANAFEPRGKKNKKGKKGKRYNFNISGGGASMGSRR